MKALSLPVQSVSPLPDDFDRRHNLRYSGAGLVVDVGGVSLPVVDVSMGGLALHGLERQLGERFRLVLARSGGTGAVAAECEVTAVSATSLHLRFLRPTLPLLQLIISHIALATGVAPHLLKRG